MSTVDENDTSGLPFEDLGRGRYEGFKAAIKVIGTGPRGSRALTFDEARAAMRVVLAGEATDAQIGAFLIAMRIKSEEVEELAGLVAGLRDATAGREPAPHPGEGLVACGGAYDGTTGDPHLSLAASFVAAACGASCVAHAGSTIGPKHGVTVVDVTAALGGLPRPDLEASRATLARSGVALVHVGEVTKGWEKLAQIRDQVGVRGPLHSAEKLVDHLGARRFIVGYTHAAYGPRLLGALDRLGALDAIAVRGIEGSDVPRPGRAQAQRLSGAVELPIDPRLRITDAGGSAETAAALTRAVLSGEETGAIREAVILGAVLRVLVATDSDDIDGARARCVQALDDGAALERLTRFVGDDVPTAERPPTG